MRLRTNKALRLTCLVLTGLGITMQLPISTPSQKVRKIKIEGVVVDKLDKGIPGVLVRAYRGVHVLDDKRSGKHGEYTLSYNSGEPITTIRYDHSDWNAATVTDVSGAKDNIINKVLIKKGEPLSYDKQREFVLILERLYVIDHINGVKEDELKRTYQNAIRSAGLGEELINELPERFLKAVENQSRETLLSGEWNSFGYAPVVTYEFKLRFRLRGEELTGETTINGHVIPIASASLKGDKLFFVFRGSRGPIELNATIGENKMEGKMNLAGDLLDVPWEAARLE